MQAFRRMRLVRLLTKIKGLIMSSTDQKINIQLTIDDLRMIHRSLHVFQRDHKRTLSDIEDSPPTFRANFNIRKALNSELRYSQDLASFILGAIEGAGACPR